MNVDRLIALVKERRALWDHSCEEHHNRLLARRLWDEIASELKQKSDAVKSKWRNLRDVFRREYKMCKRRQANGLPLIIKWKYYRSMQFIINQLTTRKPARSSEYSISSTQIKEEPLESVAESEAVEEPQCEDNLLSRLQVLENKLDGFEAGAIEDSNYHFLMSLLPFMRQLEPQSNIRARMQIQQIFIKQQQENYDCEVFENT